MKTAANIRNRLAATASGDFPTWAAELLAETGYHSERTLPGQSGDVDAFLGRLPTANPDTRSDMKLQTRHGMRIAGCG